ncbi:hypothetical protein P4B35_05090 [Pontiellaceae bacterium B12227]|nr:hypothetical protein [Pontiellaceae bacterium B12227]
MKIDVLGSGWMSKESYGSERLGLDVEYASRATLRGLGKEDGLFAYSVKNFGRFPAIAQRACYVTALAMRDAGLDYSKEQKQEIGLLGMDEYGCEKANMDYFQDYVDGGRSMARANLFIYTLPSSPLAEAAVHFGLQGPLYYYRRQDSKVDELISIARRMIEEGQADYVMVYELSDTMDRCHVVGVVD